MNDIKSNTLAEDFNLLSRVFLSVMDGDTHRIEDGYEVLRKYNIVDEDGFEIYEEEDETQISKTT